MSVIFNKNRFFVYIYLLVFVFASLSFLNYAKADKDINVGGYDIIKIAKETLFILKDKNIFNNDEYSKMYNFDHDIDDLLSIGTEINDLYEMLAQKIVEKNIVTDQEIKKIFINASESGGVKIAGINPLILETMFLDILTKKSIISVSKAQSIIDSSTCD